MSYEGSCHDATDRERFNRLTGSLTSQPHHYLSVRRTLGYDLGTSERILRRFTRFADRECETHIDTALFLRWRATVAGGSTLTRAARLAVVRPFAQWLSSFDLAHEVPPRGRGAAARAGGVAAIAAVSASLVHAISRAHLRQNWRKIGAALGRSPGESRGLNTAAPAVRCFPPESRRARAQISSERQPSHACNLPF
jgi:hypothetical protein